MTLKLNTMEFTNETSVGVMVLKYLLEQERLRNNVHFDTLKEHFAGKFSHGTLADCVHNLLENLIIDATFVQSQSGNKVYCYSIFPAYTPIVAQWLENNYQHEKHD